MSARAISGMKSQEKNDCTGNRDCGASGAGAGVGGVSGGGGVAGGVSDGGGEEVSGAGGGVLEVSCAGGVPEVSGGFC